MTRSLTARRTLAAAAVTPLLLTGFAACGDSSDSDSKASDTTQVAAFGGLEEGDEVDPSEFVDTVADGVEDSTTAHVTMKFGMGAAATTEGEGDIDYTTTPPSVSMTMTVPGAGETKTILVDGLVYVQVGELSDGKYWKIDPSDPDGMMSGLGMDKLADQSDPVGTLKSMESGIDTVTYEGDEDVDGRDLAHYEVTVDMSSVLGSMGSELPAAASKDIPESVTYDFWLDDENRFAQMKMDYPVMGQQVSVEMTASDWGTEVDIEAPPADEVTDMPSMEDMMGDLGGAPAA